MPAGRHPPPRRLLDRRDQFLGAQAHGPRVDVQGTQRRRRGGLDGDLAVDGFAAPNEFGDALTELRTWASRSWLARVFLSALSRIR